ncbi:MAG: hypothetical protein QW838_02815 [Candidatus Nitrosotenuis sp.]
MIVFEEPKTGEEAGRMWLGRVRRTLRWRQQWWNGDKAWDRFRKLYLGDHWGVFSRKYDQWISSELPRDHITVNLIGSTVLNFIPFLVRKNLRFVVKPKRPEFNVAALIHSALLNYEWNERSVREQLKKIILDTIVIGHGVAKVGYVFEIDEAVHPEKQGKIEYRDFIKNEGTFVQRVSPYRFLFDLNASEFDLQSARWCAEIIIKPASDVLANSRYSQKAVQAIRNGVYEPTTLRAFLHESDVDPGLSPFLQDVEQDEADATFLVCFEIWDKKFRKYWFFADGVPLPLREENWPYDYIESFPYFMLPFLPVIDEPYPLGLPAWVEDQQFELNRVRTRMFQHGRRFNRKYQVLRDAVDPGELTKLEQGEDGTIIQVDQLGAIQAIEDAHLSSDQYNLEGIIKQDFRELTGSDELLRGGQLPSRTTATEVDIRSRLAGLKLEDRVDAVDYFVQSIARQLLQHIKANFTTERVVRIAGLTGSFWARVSREDIEGEFDVELEVSSAERTDPVVERQQALQVLQIVLSSLQALVQAGVQVDVGELMKWFFEKFDVRDAARFFPPSGVVSPPIAPSLAPRTENAPLPSVRGVGGIESIPQTQTPQPRQTQPNPQQDILAALLGQLQPSGV